MAEPFGTLSPGPKPGLRDQLADLLAVIYGGGAGGRQMGRQASGLFDWLPGTGEALSAEEGVGAWNEGDYLGAALGAAGAVPVVGKAVKPIKKGVKAGREALAEAAPPGIAKTYKHPISGVKLKTPLEEINPTYEPLDQEMLPVKQLDFSDLLGSYVIPMRGDPTIAGQRLTGFGGNKFETPVDLLGGPDYPRLGSSAAEGVGWASNPGPSTALSNRAAQIKQETGADVYGAYMKMGEHSGDYSTMMTDTLNQMFKLDRPDQSAVDAFNTAMRTDWGAPNKRGVVPYPAAVDFPGIENLDDEWIRSHGGDRKKIAKLMDTKKFQEMGMPSSGAARYMTTEPGLLDVPSNTSGFSVIKFDPMGRVVKDPLTPHPSYAQQNVASYEGQLPNIPLDVLYEGYSTGINPSHLSKFLETKPPLVKVDERTAERVMKYLRSQDGLKLGLGGAVAAGVLSQAQADEMKGAYEAG